MSRFNRTRGGRRGYHHGNLREALIEAALGLIAEHGPSGFTVADAARAAGVSGAAPYRHFRDRDALIAGVARLGFARFEDLLRQSWDDGRPAPLAAFERLGRAHLFFARSEPALFAAMFEAGLSTSAHAELLAASERCLAIMRTACESLAALMPAPSRPPTTMMALHFFALAHGIAALYARGDEARRALPMPPEELLEAATLIYLQGLTVPQ